MNEIQAPRRPRGQMGLEFQRFSPLRAPDWRDKRVTELLNRRPDPGRPSRVWDDEIVVSWYKFCKTYQKAKGQSRERVLRTLYRQSPEIYHAWTIRSSGDQEAAAIIQARILAGQNDLEIARQFSTLPGAVAAYEALFFNVRDRLHARSAIVKSVLGPAVNRTGDQTESLDPFRTGVCYQLFGYFGGVEALEFLLFGMQHLAVPTNGTEAAEWTRQVAEAAIQRKTAMATQMMEVTKYNVMRLVELNLKLRELALLEQASSGANRDRRLEEIVTAFISQSQLEIGQKGFKRATAQDGLNFHSPVEMRSDMLARAPDLKRLSDGLQDEYAPAIQRLNVRSRTPKITESEAGSQ